VGTLELALELADPRLRTAMLQLDGGAQLASNSLQRYHTRAQSLAALVHRGETSCECVALLLGILRGGLRLLHTPPPTVALCAVAAARAHGGLFGLDAQLLLGVLALLDTAQLQLALGQLHGGALPHTLALGLAPAQIGDVGLQGAYRLLGPLGAAQQSRVAQPRAAGTALGERVLLLLLRGAFAPCLVFLRDHHASEYERDRTGRHRTPRPLTSGRGWVGSHYSSSRNRHAMRDCSDHSSMKPGEAVWEKRPPDCENEARLASYTACGDSRVTTRAWPL